MKAGTALNAADKEKVNSYKEVDEDLKLEPSERKRGILDFKVYNFEKVPRSFFLILRCAPV